MMHRPHILSVLASIALSFLVTAECRADDDRSWRVHFGALYTDPDLGLEGEVGIRVATDAAHGFELGISRRFHRRWSFAAEVGRAAPDLSVSVALDGSSVTLIDDVEFLPITAGFDLHLTPERRVDLFLGARLAFIRYGDVTLQEARLGRQSFDADTDIGLGLVLGLDTALGNGPWSLRTAVSYLDTDLTLSNREDGAETTLDFDPISLSVGVGYRF